MDDPRIERCLVMYAFQVVKTLPLENEGSLHHMLRIPSAHGEAVAFHLISPLQSCHKFEQDDVSAAKALHSVACGISFLSSHCPDWQLLKYRHILYKYLKRSWLFWNDHSRMSLTQVILELLVCNYGWEIKWELIGTVRNRRGMVEQDAK